MLLVVIVVLLAVLAALLAGGRLDGLAHLSWTGLRWLVAAAGIQTVGWLLSGWIRIAYPLGMLASAVCIGVFLGGNLRRSGVALLALGFVCNALVVVLNGAMPVSPRALARAGVDGIVSDPRHELTGDGTRLGWLGDVIPLALPGIGQAISAGDILVAAGAGLMVYAAMTGTARRPARHSVPIAPAAVRLSEDDNRRLRRYAQRHGYSLNEAVHHIITDADRTSEPSEPEAAGNDPPQ